MAKMFYTIEETKAALSLNEEEIKDLVRQTRLREFRDGPRLMFKADQVETLKSEIGSSRGGDLGPSDSGAPLGLADSRGPSGTGTSLTLSDDSAAGGRSPGGGLTLKDDTALAADLGLSGSLGGMPSPTRLTAGGGSGSGLSGLSGLGSGAGRSGSGVSVFQPEEVEHADPSAQTAISSSSGIGDSVGVEGVGSGSGLLDLTRERDDTSLGAELLDEISPSGKTRAGDSGVASGSGTMSSLAEPRGGVTRTIVTPTYIEAPDSLAPALGGFALGAAAAVMFGIFVLTSAVVGHYPPIVKQMADYSLWAIAGAGIGLAILFFIVGMLFGKAGARR